MELLNLIEASDVVYRLGWTLLHVIWLGAAAGLVLAAALRLMKSRSSQARYAVACAALVAVLAVSVGTFFAVSVPERQAPAAVRPVPGPVTLPPRSPATVTLPPMPAGVTLPPAPPATVAEMPVVAETPLAVRAVKVVEPALPYIVMAWCLGVLALSLWQLTGWMLVQRLRRLAAVVQEPALVESARRLAHAMRVSRPVRLLESTLVRVPTVIGWLRPVILLPIGFATGLTSEQVQAVLAHELAHIRRHDYLINLLQVLVETLFFYHPAVWYISRRIRAERENCCDDMALAAGAERFSYAESLVLLARQSGGKGKPSRAAAAFLGVTGRPSQLKSRIGRLVGSAESEGPSRVAWPAALVVLITFITAAAIVAGCLSGRGGDANHEDKQPSGAFAATLPCGIKVELVGIAEKDPKTWGEDPSHTGTWWQPDGSPLAHLPEGKAVGGWTFGPSVPNLKTYKMLARITWPQDVEKAVGGREWPRWFIDPPMDSTWAYNVYNALESTPPQEDLQLVGISIPESARTTDVSLSVASGPWQTVAALGLGHGRQWLVPDVGVDFTAFTEDSVTHSTTIGLYTMRIFDRKPWRLVAVDTEGKLHVAGDRPASSSGGMRPTTIDLPLAKIKELRFEVRPVQTVVFENVSLAGTPPAAGTPPVRTVLMAKLAPPTMFGYRSVLIPSQDDRREAVTGPAAPGVRFKETGSVLNLATGELVPMPSGFDDPKTVNAWFRDQECLNYPTAAGGVRKETCGFLAYDGQLIAFGGTQVYVDTKASPYASMANNVLFGDLVVHLPPPAGTHLTIDVASAHYEAILGPVTDAGLWLYYRPAGGWGFADHGVQTRLKADKAQWKAGETPTLKADIRNTSEIGFLTAQAQQLWELEVDGQRYTWSGDIGVKSSVLASGHGYDNIPFTLEPAWHTKDANRPSTPLALAPGKHTVRVVGYVRSSGDDRGWFTVTAISNPVEIEILSADGKPAAAAGAVPLAEMPGLPVRTYDLPPDLAAFHPPSMVNPWPTNTEEPQASRIEPVLPAAAETPAQKAFRRQIEKQVKTSEPWESAGGRAAMQFKEQGSRFIVRQTPEGHEQIAKLLAGRLEKVTAVVQMECRFIGSDMADTKALSQWLAQELNLKAVDRPDRLEDRYPLSKAQATAFLAEIQKRPATQVLAAPRLTLFSGAPAYVCIGQQCPALLTHVGKPTEERVELTLGTTLGARAVISDDQRSIRISLRPQVTEPLWDMEPKYSGQGPMPVLMADADITVDVPAGGAVLIPMLLYPSRVTGFRDSTEEERPWSQFQPVSERTQKEPAKVEWLLVQPEITTIEKSAADAPKIAAIVVPAEAPWGEAVEGVKVRLRPEKAAWKAGEVPYFIADISNSVEAPFAGQGQELSLELKVDGQWYAYEKMPHDEVVLPAPHHDLRDYLFTLSGRWKSKEGGKKLNITPGRHLVQLAAVFHTADGKGGELRAFSRPVTMEIPEATTAEPQWGKEVDGLQASIQMSKPAYAAGEPVEVEVGFRNNSKADRIINVGMLLGAGQQIPDAIHFDFAADSMDRDLTPKPVFIGGTVEDWFVPLAAGKTWSLKIKLADYWCAADPSYDFSKLAPGTYGLSIAYEGKGRQHVNIGDAPPDPAKLWTGKLFSGAAFFTVRAPWGEAVEGVQTRLRADKVQWKAGEVPTFKADIRNTGKEDLTTAQSQVLWELQVDGQWYTWSGDISVKSSALPPGREYHDIGFTLESAWHSRVGQAPLALAPGKHTVCVAAHIAHADDAKKGPVVCPTSNPVEIEILPADAKAAEVAWGEAVQGLRARLLMPEKPLKAGEAGEVVVEVESVSDKPLLWERIGPLFSIWGTIEAVGPQNEGVKLVKGVRLATAEEVRRELNTVRPGLTGTMPFPGVYHLDPGGRMRITSAVQIEHPGRYHAEAKLVRATLNGHMWLGTDEIECRPIDLSVVAAAGQTAPPAAKAAEPPWGAAVGGVQVRLKADKAQWKVGETPTLRLDVANRGAAAVPYSGSPDLVDQGVIEVDGTWYTYTGAIVAIAYGSNQLPAGRQLDKPLEVYLGPFLTPYLGAKSVADLARLVPRGPYLSLGPGKHTVRAAYWTLAKDPATGRFMAWNAVKAAGIEPAVSNPVEIEILPAGVKPAAGGADDPLSKTQQPGPTSVWKGAAPEVEKAYAKAIQALLPKGWSVKQLDTKSETKLEISRDEPAPYFYNGPSAPGRPAGEPPRATGQKPYVLALTFSPALSAEELARLRAENAATEEKMAAMRVKMQPFWGKGWQPRNDADKVLLAEYEALGALLHRLPDYVTPAASVSVGVEVGPGTGLEFLSKDVTAECSQVRDSVEALLGSAATVAGAWGESDEGVRVALRPEKPQWKVGETPWFFADVSDLLGDHPFNVAHTQEIWELQVDGQWYGWSGPFSIRPALLAPGHEFLDIPFTLVDTWVAKDGGKKLVLTPGQHIVRVAALCQSADPKVADARPVSRPVAIEILPAAADAPTEKPAEAKPPAPAAAGNKDLRLELSRQQFPFRDEPWASLQLTARNTGKEIINVGPRYALAYIGPDGKQISDAIGPRSSQPTPIEPGKSVELSKWAFPPQDAKPGRYQVWAQYFTPDDAELVAESNKITVDVATPEAVEQKMAAAGWKKVEDKGGYRIYRQETTVGKAKEVLGADLLERLRMDGIEGQAAGFHTNLGPKVRCEISLMVDASVSAADIAVKRADGDWAAVAVVLGPLAEVPWLEKGMSSGLSEDALFAAGARPVSYAIITEVETWMLADGTWLQVSRDKHKDYSVKELRLGAKGKDCSEKYQAVEEEWAREIKPVDVVKFADYQAAKGAVPPRAIAASLPPELKKKRDALMAQADQKLRQGLHDLAKAFPALATTEYRSLEAALKDQPPQSDRISIWLAHNARSQLESVPEAQTWNLLAYIQPIPTNGRGISMVQFPFCPHLNLEGQWHAVAGDPKLQAALQKLLDDALAPLKALDAEAAKLPATAGAEAAKAAAPPALEESFADKVERVFGLSKAPHTSDLAKLPDLWQEQPAGSKSYEMRAGVIVGRHPKEFFFGDFFYLPDKDVFYVQHGPLGSSDSSTQQFYGPFKGKPWDRLGIPESSTMKVPTWGEAVEGVQVRLAADKAQWKAGETPILTADVRNQGKRDLRVFRTSMGPAELEIDGLWHQPMTQELILSSDFGPGEEYVGIAFRLDDASWANEGKAGLKLTPGKHTVRVAIAAQPATDSNWNPVRAVSNPVEIEILPADAKAAPAAAAETAEPVAGEEMVLSVRDGKVRVVVDGREMSMPGGSFFLRRNGQVVKDAFEAVDGQVKLTMGPRESSVQGIRVVVNLHTGEASAQGGLVPAIANLLETPKPPAEPKQSWIEIGGQVVDDKTGQPVVHFALQTGFVDPKDPSKVGWGGEQTTDVWRDGKFSEKEGCLEGQKMWYRIVAAGYASQPITPQPLTAPATAKGLVVRMKRGGEISGRVVDAAGKPVDGAAVYLGGDQVIDFADGQVPYFRGSSVNTDSAGRFLIAGTGDKSSLVVVCGPPDRPGPLSRTMVWWAPPPAAGEDIRLPQPAGLKITYDIDGAPVKAKFHLELKTWEMPGWQSVVNVHLSPECAAGAAVTLPYLAPGVYDLARQVDWRVGDAGGSFLCDRMTVTLEAGKTAEVSFVRKTGAPITGQVHGLEGTGAAGAIIRVLSEKATGDPWATDEWKLPIYDALICGMDGAFKTSRLVPGTYTVAAWAYKPETLEERGRLGRMLPALMGVAKVVVPETGDPKPIEIDLKPLPVAAEAMAGKPAEAPAPAPAKPATHSLTWEVYDGTGDPATAIYVLDGERIDKGAAGLDALRQRIAKMPRGSEVRIIPYYGDPGGSIHPKYPFDTAELEKYSKPFGVMVGVPAAA